MYVWEHCQQSHKLWFIFRILVAIISLLLHLFFLLILSFDHSCCHHASSSFGLRYHPILIITISPTLSLEKSFILPFALRCRAAREAIVTEGIEPMRKRELWHWISCHIYHHCLIAISLSLSRARSRPCSVFHSSVGSARLGLVWFSSTQSIYRRFKHE